MEFRSLIEKHSKVAQLDPALIEKIIMAESKGDPNAKSSAGAQGLMQIMPETAKEIGLENPFDPEENIKAGTKYFAELHKQFKGDTRKALAAYNWGQGNVKEDPELKNAPKETHAYIKKVMGIEGIIDHDIVSKRPPIVDHDLTPAQKTKPGEIINQVILNTLSSLGSFIGGGVAGAGRMVFSRGSIEERLQKANITQEETQAFIANLPQTITRKEITPEAQKVMEVLGWPFEKLHEGAGWLGEKAEEITGVPYIEPGIATVAEAIPYILGPKFLKSKLIDKPIERARVAASAKNIEERIPPEKTMPIPVEEKVSPIQPKAQIQEKVLDEKILKQQAEKVGAKYEGILEEVSGEQIPIFTFKKAQKKLFDTETDTLSTWVQKKGGINYQRETLKGELDRLREFGKGQFLVNKQGKGKTLDDLTQQAITEGFLNEGATSREFLDLLETDLSAKTTGQKIYSKQKQEFISEEEFLEGYTRFLSDTGIVIIRKKPKPQFTDEAFKVEEMYNRADKAIKELHKKSFKKTYKFLKTQTVDVAGNLKKELLTKHGDMGKQVVMHHDLIAGASTKAMRDFKLASDRIFQGLSEIEREYLNRFIQSRRTIAIEEYKQIKHPEGLGTKEHQAYLNQMPKDLWNDLNQRANFYFEEMRAQLKQLLNEKIISQESYDALIKSGDYSPRRFLQHIDPEITYEIGGKKITVPDSGIKALDKGSYGLLEKDASLLLNQIISRTQGRIFRNRANKELYYFAKTVPENGVVQLAKVIRTTEEGKPIYQEAPAGYEKVKVMIEGHVKEMMMPSEMANEWIMRDPILTAGQASALRWLSGSAILKPMATGLNPEFALTNFPRDLAHIWITDYSRVYSPHLPVYMAQMGKDLATVFKDSVTRKGRWVDYINEGGGMEFLTHQGRITTSLEGLAKDIQNVMGWLGETSEILPRLALRERALKKGLSPTEATWRARDYLDFTQGGSFIKAADTVVPYLNAGIQGTRGVFRAAAMKPGVFAYKVAQIGTLATSLYYMNRFLNPEAWEQVSPREKINNFIITTPFSYKDSEGTERYIYFKIAKDQGQRTMASIFEGMAGKVIGDEIDVDQIVQSVQDAIPIIPSQSLPPLMDALLGYGANKDFWRNEEIWRGPEVEPKEEWTNYTHPLFIKAGALTSLSPERLKYALQQYFTYGNVWTSLGGFAWKQILDKMPETERQKVTEDIILEKPFIRRIAKKTDPYVKHEKPLEEAKVEATTEQWKLTREFDSLSQGYYDGTIMRDEIEHFFNDAPDIEKRRLRDRHIRRGKFQELPEKRYWLNLAEINPPEARANVFWNRWRTAKKEEREMLEKYAGQVPGIISERFLRQLRILKKKSEQLEGGNNQ